MKSTRVLGAVLTVSLKDFFFIKLRIGRLKNNFYGSSSKRVFSAARLGRVKEQNKLMNLRSTQRFGKLLAEPGSYSLEALSRSHCITKQFWMHFKLGLVFTNISFFHFIEGIEPLAKLIFTGDHRLFLDWVQGDFEQIQVVLEDFLVDDEGTDADFLRF